MIIIDNEIIADEGYTLFNGEIYSPHIFLSIYDSPSNWLEVPIEEVEQDG